MGEQVWKRINVVGPRAVNGLNVAVYGRYGPEKSWTVPSTVARHLLRKKAKLLNKHEI